MGSNISCVQKRNSIQNQQLMMNMNSAFAKLNSDEWIDLKIAKKQQISRDVYLIRFNFPKIDMYSGLEICQHFMLKAQIDEDLIMREYTPFTKNDVKGYMECIIKIYRKYSHPDYPNGGVFTTYLENKLDVGDNIAATGPRGKFIYQGRGQCSIDMGINNTKYINFKHLGLICSGSGLAPLLQMASHVASDRSDETKVYMLNGNSTEEDVLLKTQLDQLAKNDKMTINLTVSRPSNGWTGWKGRISKESIEQTLPKNVDKKDVFICICGSDAIHATSKKALKELGYNETQIFSF